MPFVLLGCIFLLRYLLGFFGLWHSVYMRCRFCNLLCLTAVLMLLAFSDVNIFAISKKIKQKKK